jgi:predicted amidophosphoribosyltransferase
VAGKIVRFRQDNIRDFLDRIPPAMARMLARHVSAPATIIPIPNSHVIDINSPNFQTLQLARLVAKAGNHHHKVIPALFRRPQIKSRQGGSRDPGYLEQELRIVKRVAGPIILLDDVCTTGAHFKAACWKLRSAQNRILFACAFGRSTKEQMDSPIGLHEEYLDLRPPRPIPF